MRTLKEWEQDTYFLRQPWTLGLKPKAMNQWRMMKVNSNEDRKFDVQMLARNVFKRSTGTIRFTEAEILARSDKTALCA